MPTSLRIAFWVVLVMAVPSWFGAVVFGYKALGRTTSEHPLDAFQRLNFKYLLFCPSWLTPEGLKYREYSIYCIAAFLLPTTILILVSVTQSLA